MESQIFSTPNLDTAGRIELKAPLCFEKYNAFISRLDFFSQDFKVAYPERIVHNIYFDTLDLKLLEASKEGEFTRAKIRLRHYNLDTFGQLEFKLKEGRLVTKAIKLIPTSLESISNIQKEIVELARSENKLVLAEATFPSLKNSYSRRYLEHRTGIRMTIDTKLKFHSASGIPAVGSELEVDNNAYAVIEWKFEPNLINEFNEIYRQKFPFKLDKFSKYVHGMALLGW